MMKFLPLIWKGLSRNPTRTALIFVQITIAFVLFGVVQGMNAGVQHVITATHADRLYVVSRVSFGDALPFGFLSKLQAIPGAVAVNFRQSFPATYQRPNQFLVAFATDPQSFFSVFPDIHVPQAQLQAMLDTPVATIVGQLTAQRFGWKVGDRIALQSFVPQRNGSRDWTFDIVGIYTQPDQPEQAVSILLNYRYVNEARLSDRDTVNMFTLRITNPADAALIGHRIDTLFGNSSHETRTQSETELAQSLVKRIGDVEFLAHTITAAAFFALLFATGTLMMQSVRERSPELAVLKTVGFSDALIMRLLLGESVTLSVGGAVLGLCLGSLLMPYARSYFGVGFVSMDVVLAALVAALVLALLGGAVPAWRAGRLEIVDALAGR